ncbi:M23 family metallopeptidase [Deinococcus sp.]|uniref:M23 family metallopeptidase n=1 Tax=Deinococcus sp. TaxID=47478 RepID=UPI0025D03B58|nr:M23 family metallopeptidase [Deinococcus sp.]
MKLMLRRLISVLLVLALLGGLALLAWPALQNARRYAELLRAPGPQGSSLAAPLPGVRYADTWGTARSEGRRHEGVDIFAPRGTPILATVGGVVGRVGLDRLGGRIVYVTGPGGYHHYYAHLERYADLERGQWISAGTVVGYVGDSGNAQGTPPHLHYGVYSPGWQATNPYPLLRKSSVARNR